MKKLIYITEKNDVDKFISVLTLGVVYCLKEKIISIEDAEGFIFKPFVSSLLKDIKSDEDLINIIELGCELEDVASLIPQSLNNNLSDLFDRIFLFIKNKSKTGFLINKDITITDK